MLHVAVEDELAVNGVSKAHAKPLLNAEIAALRYAAAGLNDNEIAERMKIAHTTAYRHVENARRKIGVSSRSEAISKAEALGIVTRL